MTNVGKRMLLAAAVVWAPSGAQQGTPKPLTFEVASVKPFSPGAVGGGRKGGGPTGPGTSDPGRIHYAAIRLKDLVMNAYNVKDYQIAGPTWLDSGDESSRFTVDATMPPDTTKEQLRVMLQNLLAERFKLAVHHETRDLPKYSLTVAKGGPRMKESAEYRAPKETEPLPGRGRRAESYDRYGFPTPQMRPEGGTWSWMINGRGRLGGERATMQDLVNELEKYHLRTPITDDTGLKGKYDFLLTYSRPRVDTLPADMPEWVTNPPEVLEAIPDLFGALQSQLGLKLDAKKGPAEMIVIDRIEKKPTEN